MGGVLKPVGKLFGFDSDAAKKAAEQQANAIRDTNAAQMRQAQDQAAAAQSQQEAAIAQRNAMQQAQVDMQAPESPDVDVTPAAGDDEATRKRKPREQFQSGGGTAGIRIT